MQGVYSKATWRNAVLYHTISTRDEHPSKGGSIKQPKSIWDKMAATGTGPRRGRPRWGEKNCGTAGIWRWMTTKD